LLAPDLKEELPVLYLRVRDAVVNDGLRVIEVSTHDTGMTRYATESIRYAPGEAADAIRDLRLDGSVVCILGRPSVAESAHGVVAAAGYAEKSGTTTNLEGRVSRLNQKVTPPGTARPDWMLAVELADRMGGDLGFTSLEDVWDEIERLAPSMQGITRARMASREGLDGILAGRSKTDASSGPPSMGQTESPEIVAAQEQGETQFLPVEDANASSTAAVSSDHSVPAGADAVGDEAHP